jgi:Uma2 family endonuclease
MGMPQSAPTWTAAQVRLLPPDGKRYEVIDGELLVTQSPATPHQRAVGELHLLLAPYLRSTSAGEVFLSPADVQFDPDTMVQPDLFVVPLVEGRRLREWAEIEGLVLAIEVLSPSTAHHDRLTKRRLYQREGIEYWIVDLDARLVECWRPDDSRPEILTETLEWTPVPGLAPLVIELPGFFAEAWAEQGTAGS